MDGRVSDLAVRQRLRAPSLESLIRQRRLLYFATLMRSDAHALITMVSLVGADGQPLLPWTRMLFEDLRALRTFHGHKLSELGDPSVDAQSWVRLAVRYPRPWSELVNTFVVQEAAREAAAPAAAVGPQHVCHTCSAAGCPSAFHTAKSLQAHMRSKHGVHNALKRYVDGTGVCPVCCTKFASRTRLLSHVAERRMRGRASHTCGMVLATGAFPQLDPLTSARCDAADAQLRKKARTEGHSQPLARHAAAKRTKRRCEPDDMRGLPRRRVLAKVPDIERQRAKVRSLLFTDASGPRKKIRVAGKSPAHLVARRDLLATARRIATQGA